MPYPEKRGKERNSIVQLVLCSEIIVKKNKYLAAADDEGNFIVEWMVYCCRKN